MIFGRGRKAPPTAHTRGLVPVGPARKLELEGTIPMGVEIAGQWAWRLLAVVAAIAVFGFLIVQLRDIVIPLLVAILVAALLVPFVQFLTRHRWPKALAVALAMILTIGVVGGLVVLVVTQIRMGLPDLQSRTTTAYSDFLDFLRTSPLQINETEFNGYVDQAFTALQDDSGVLVTGALSVGATAGHVLTGFLLVLFSTLFILIDGKGIWAWVVRIFPRKARPAIGGAGHAGWLTLTTFVKVQIFVAFVDALGIGLVAFFLGLPLTIPIAVVVFLASFIPVVGAVASGAIAVFIALIYGGGGPALIMLAGVLAVQQVEGHVLQPLVMGTAVKVHPLAVVLSVAAAGFVAGIPGALFAVPFIAVLNVMVKYIASGQWRSGIQPELGDVARTTDVVK
jgi:predicted PurR-regulated permease PerM